MNGYLLDTNVLSEPLKPSPEARIQAWLAQVPASRLHISAITLGEIRRGIALLAEGSHRARLEHWMEHELREWFGGRILAIDAPVAETWGSLRVMTARLGRTLPVLDSLIAATALHFTLTLVTRNVRDFQETGVRLFNPWDA
ncbi:MAG: PIN domain-containing protein [Terriglobales bacterium]